MFQGSRRRRPSPVGRGPRIFDLAFGQYSSVRLMKAFYFVAILAVTALLVGPATYFFRHGSDMPEPYRLQYAGAVVGLLLLLLVVRVLAECVIVVFRIAEDLRELVHANRQDEITHAIGELVTLNQALLRRLDHPAGSANGAARARTRTQAESPGPAGAAPATIMAARATDPVVTS